MRLAVLGSGSRGNGLLVESGGSCLLVDCGFSLRTTEQRLDSLGRSPADLTAILVTHEHSDHIKGVQSLALKYRLPVYMTHGTARHHSVAAVDRQLISAGGRYLIGDIEVRPVTVPHDANEPCQFVFGAAGRRVGVLTDLGHLTPTVYSAYSGCDGLYLEANHDEQRLANGAYPPSLKRRVGGDWGHLSNRQAAQFLSQLDLRRLQHVVVGHISEQNNSVEQAMAVVQAPLPARVELTPAVQHRVLDWLEIK